MRRTATAFDRYLADIGPIDASIFAEGEGFDPMQVAAVNGVEAAIGFRWFLVVPEVDREGFYPMFVPDDPRIPNDYLRFPLVARPSPNPTEPFEVALGERTARRLGVDVGDALPMVSYTPGDLSDLDLENPDGPRLDLAVVGIVRDQGDIASRGTDLDPTVLTPAFAARYEDQIALFGRGMLLDLDPQVPVDAVIADFAALGEFEFATDFGQEAFRVQLDPTLDSMATGLRIAAPSRRSRD